MARRFTPVADPEKTRSEQDEESLRKHRQFDTPFTLLPSNLNDKRRTDREDLEPLGRKADDLVQDEKGLWRKKADLFDKQKTWGRETVEYTDPEQARVEGNAGPKWGRPGVVGWGTQGSFGGRGEDKGLQVLQRSEVNQTMEKNEKGLWVRKKAPREAGEGEDGEPSASKGRWRCAKCGKETAVALEFCRQFECDGRRPAAALAADLSVLRPSNPNEDPRLEAAKKKGRGTEDAAKQALKALEERRQREQGAKERLGMMHRPSMGGAGDAGRATLNSGRQVRPAPRVKHCHRWQGVQRTDEEAKKVVSKAVGGATELSGAPLRVEDSERSAMRRGSRAAGGGGGEADDPYGDLPARLAGSASRSRSRSRSSAASADSGRGAAGAGGEALVVVDFF